MQKKKWLKQPVCPLSRHFYFFYKSKLVLWFPEMSLVDRQMMLFRNFFLGKIKKGRLEDRPRRWLKP